jgi:hypothetical protein
MIQPLTIRLSLVRLCSPLVGIALVALALTLFSRSAVIWEIAIPTLGAWVATAAALWALIRLEVDGAGVHGVSLAGRSSIRWPEIAGAGAGATRFGPQAVVRLTPEAAAVRGGAALGLGPHWAMGADEIAGLIAACAAAAGRARE